MTLNLSKTLGLGSEKVDGGQIWASGYFFVVVREGFRFESHPALLPSTVRGRV